METRQVLSAGSSKQSSPPRFAHQFFIRPLAMVFVALALRLIVMAFLYPEQLNPDRDHWSFAYENGRLARSIAEGRGFSSPLFEPTGPSAWMTPVYPYINAAVFKVFGIYTTASAFVMLSFQALISALTCLPIFFFARNLLGPRVAVWSGWAWTFFPYGIYFPAERIWSTWLSTLLLTILFLITLKLEQSTRLWHWIGYGVLWALAALTDPIAMAAWPFCVAWAVYHLHRRQMRWAVPLVASILALTLCVAPWFIRNHNLFGRVVPFRDTLGLEIHLGNNGDTSHWRPRMIGPWHNQQEWNDFKQLGELGYMDREKHRGLDFIRSHPGWFAWVTIRRFVYIWTGYWSLNKAYLQQEPLDPPNILFCASMTVLALLGLRRLWLRDRARAAFFALILFLFPAIYYVTHVEVYYRRQIDPLILVLAVYGVVRKPDEFAGKY